MTFGQRLEQRTVDLMFSRIARRYDLANDALSFGIHRSWRKRAIASSRLRNGAVVIDLCTGSGDFMRAALRSSARDLRLIGVDTVREMLVVARKKLRQRVALTQGNAAALPFRSASADAVTIGFGIRNVEAFETALVEIRRVLKPGGMVVILEFGQPASCLFGRVYRLYSRLVLPRLGALITRDRSAYEYLRETAAIFPSGGEFGAILQRLGFSNVNFQALCHGIAYLYRAERAPLPPSS